MTKKMNYRGGEGKYYKDNPEAVWRRDQTKMFVNGKYIPKSHPLHKPGRYKNFEDAAFKSLAKYESSVEGQVYVVVNPNFPEWVKVGMAIDAEDRLNNYQTSSPFRDYVLNYKCDVSDRRSAESEAHSATPDSRGVRYGVVRSHPSCLTSLGTLQEQLRFGQFDSGL